MASNTPFDPPYLLQLVVASLSHEAAHQPQLNTATDGIAIFTHACLLSIGFRLLGISEDERLESPIEALKPRPLPHNWLSQGGSYCFRYAHSQSALHYLIRINRLGSRTIIMGLGIGDDKTTTLDVVTKDYMSESFFPYSMPSSADITAKIQDGFISESRLRDLATLIKINVVQQLVPSIIKEGYAEETPRAGSGGGGSSQPRSPQHPPQGEDPLRVPRPYGPMSGGFPRAGPPPIPAGGERPPGFEDEYEILRPPRGYRYPSGQNPLSIGADDLNPPGLGSNPPLRGPFFGEGPGGFGGGSMGGMYPGPDHPMFGGGGVPNPRAPPGARYDPVGPGDYPPSGGLRGPRGPGPQGPPGSGPFNPFSGFGSGDFM